MCRWSVAMAALVVSARCAVLSFAPPPRRTFFTALRRALAAPAPAAVEEEVDPGEVAGLRIVKYPHPALRAANAEVPKEEVKGLADLSKRMFELMYEAQGVGLAAPQVGVNKRVMVFNPEGAKEKWLDEGVFINPQIVAASEGMDGAEEGCLSFPGMGGAVSRHKWVKVQGLNLKGKPIKKKYTGWTARIFQHEYDHLDGVCYVDRLGDRDRETIAPDLAALADDYGDGGAEDLLDRDSIEPHVKVD